MFMKTKEIVELTQNVVENKRVVLIPWSVFRATPYPDVGEPRMFMKTNQIVELTQNVTENKRVVRSGGRSQRG